MAMIDRKIMDSFEQEWEIPDSVTEKMQEAYRQIGAGEIDVTAHGHRKGRRIGRRYLKAASFAAAVLILGVTAGAATGLNEPLQRLFQKDADLARESSSNPDTKPVKNTLKDLEIEVESISGTEEVAYIVLHVQRKDGSTFDKNKEYDFDSINIWDEELNNAHRGEADYASSESGHSFMIENEGTSEVRIGYLTTYKRQIGSRVEYRKGKQCKLQLKDWVEKTEEGDRSDVLRGELELSFKMDYGNALTKTKKTNVNISFPAFETGEYYPMGRLREFTVTPYYIEYKTLMTEKQWGQYKSPDHQIYAEMDDGSFVGYQTEDDFRFRRMGVNLISSGDASFADETGMIEFDDIVIFPELIDVKHVRAVYFGKTRIELS